MTSKACGRSNWNHKADPVWFFMKIQIIAVGQKMPAWVDQASHDYLKRLPSRQLSLSCVATAQRKSGHTIERLQQQESDRIKAKIKPGSLNIALDEHGKQWSTQQWAEQYKDWLLYHPMVNFVIGGPDGLSADILSMADRTIALGRMTLPHGLARVVLIEQLYRAWSVVEGHPYHRE
jgi:23S rRNA (pseudouridine1915-N3)-methyltransferase